MGNALLALVALPILMVHAFRIIGSLSAVTVAARDTAGSVDAVAGAVSPVMTTSAPWVHGHVAEEPGQRRLDLRGHARLGRVGTETVDGRPFRSSFIALSDGTHKPPLKAAWVGPPPRRPATR